MRKSNQWIGGGVLSVIILATFVNVSLHRELRQGHVWSLGQQRAAQCAHYRLSGLHKLVLSGAVWVNVIPGDSDVIQVPAEEVDMDSRIPGLLGPKLMRGGSKSLLHQTGDTLFIQGNVEQPLHRPFADWYYRQSVGQIYVYASSLSYVRITNGQVLLYGRSNPKDASVMTLDAQDATVWIGEMDDRPEAATSRHPLPKEYFDTIVMHLTNTVSLLNKPAVIQGLEVRLDSASEINDRHATLGRSEIHASADSRISFTALNLSKIIVKTD